MKKKKGGRERERYLQRYLHLYVKLGKENDSMIYLYVERDKEERKFRTIYI